MELITKEGAANEFFQGIMPPAMIAQMSAKIKSGGIDQKDMDEMLYGNENEAPDTIVSSDEGDNNANNN